MDEGIVRDVAEVFDIRLEAPIPVVLEEKFMMIEFPVVVSSAPLLVVGVHIPRVESAHMMIALHATVHDGLVTLLCNAFLRDCGVGPLWEAPVLCRYLTPLNGCTCVVQDSLFERLVEDSVVQKYIRVVVPPIEVSLNRLDRLYDTVQLLVSRQNNEGSVCSGGVDARLETSYGEWLVIFLADLPMQV
jgi:hypothetical protein